MVIALTIITGLFLLAYCILIVSYFNFFKRLSPFKPQSLLSPTTGFSIIIPARNEEDNIEACIQSILANNYPPLLFEIIVADDFSTDNTAGVVKNLQQLYPNIVLIQLSELVTDKLNSYKKKAIELAIARSSKEWILTTDADCIVPANWLKLFDGYIQTYKPVFIAAPVFFKRKNSFISIFQSLDFMSLQGITAASVSAGFHSMCNGANLGYKKSVFYEAGGFKGVDQLASGDDMLLMHKIQLLHPKKIGYLFNPDSIVITDPMPDIKSFINQRIRWASKSTSYTDKRIFSVLLLVYITNLLLLIFFIAGIFYYQLLFISFLFIGIKTISELVFLYPVSKFYNQEKMLWWFPVMQPFHIFYTVVSGFLGKFGKYQWKGRTVK